MADILDRLGNDSQLGKVIFELLSEVAASAVLKANKADRNDATVSPLPEARVSPACKSVPVSPKEDIATPRLVKSDDGNEKEQSINSKTVDPSLGRPRYHWQDVKSPDVKDRKKHTAELKELFSVYVGHLPTDITEDELMDLFKDIGEVIDVFVFPAQNKNYTYG